MSYAKNWCFTLNNPEEDDYRPFPFNPDVMQYVVLQLEEGASGTPHFQGYIQFKEKKRLAGVKRYVGDAAHVEVAKGSAKQNETYCTKAEGRLEGPWRYGVPTTQGQRNDIRAFVDALKERDLTEDDLFDEFAPVNAKYRSFVKAAIQRKRQKGLPREELVPRPGWQSELADYLAGEPDDRKVRWYYDAAGGSGKTTFRKRYGGKPKFFVMGGRHSDIYHAYDGQPVVFFDMPRDMEEIFPYSVLENMKNGSIFSPKYESCVKEFAIPHVIVFANFQPDRTKLSADRWDVHIINDNPLQ